MTTLSRLKVLSAIIVCEAIAAHGEKSPAWNRHRDNRNHHIWHHRTRNVDLVKNHKYDEDESSKEHKIAVKVNLLNSDMDAFP